MSGEGNGSGDHSVDRSDSRSGRDAVPGPREVRVYVNERGVSVPRGSSALDAVRACCAQQASDVSAGSARLTDSRGLPIEATRMVSGGLILRVLPVRDRTVSDTSEGEA